MESKPSIRRLIEKTNPTNGNDQIKAARKLIRILSEKLGEDFIHGYNRVDCPVLAHMTYPEKMLSEKQLAWICQSIAREFGAVQS